MEKRLAQVTQLRSKTSLPSSSARGSAPKSCCSIYRDPKEAFMSGQRDWAALIGRILLCILFIESGFGKIGGFEGTAGYIASRGLPFPQVLAAISILIELGGGLAV